MISGFTLRITILPCLFITFCADIDPSELKQRIRSISENVEEKGYTVSIGSACHPKEGLNMEALMKEAEAKMYEAKRAFYENSEHERRHTG